MNRDLAKVLTEFPAGFMEPIFIGDPPLYRAQPSCAIGTATLVSMGGRFFAITCHHVLQAFRGLHGHPRHFQIGELALDPENQLIAETQELDLAIIGISPSQVLGQRSGDGLCRTRFFQPRTWPPDPVTLEDVISLAGFPGVWREQDGVNKFTMFMFGHGATEVVSVAQTHFVTRIELDRCVTFHSIKEVSDLGGMSGGPVFRWRRGELEPQLVGIVYEYQAEYDLLFIRSTGVLLPNGTLDYAAA